MLSESDLECIVTNEQIEQRLIACETKLAKELGIQGSNVRLELIALAVARLLKHTELTDEWLYLYSVWDEYDN